MSIIVDVENVWKIYGKVEALKGVSLRVREGEIYGLVGPNGAGKTTLLRIIAGLVKPTSGSVRVAGVDPYKDFLEARSLISYLPEEAGTYDFLTGYEHLVLYAKLYGLGRSSIEYGAELSGLGERLWDYTRNYSKGMKRRLLLALILMTKPRLALLDEPTAGLDVHASLSVRRAIRKHVERTKSTVIVSSHNMLEIEYLCDRVGLISGGKIVAEGSVDELLSRYNARNLEEVFEAATGGLD